MFRYFCLMKLARDQVLHIAKLARLQLSDDEIETYTNQLASILGYIEILNEVDTSQVEPTAQVTGLKNVMDADHVMKKSDCEALLACSPLPKEDHQIRVKPVFE